MKIGIVGYGHVGKAMAELFKDVAIYDEPLNIGTKDEINQCDIAFICVPTPSNKDGSCDTSIVEEVISWLDVETIVIRSTVYVGFTRIMSEKYNKSIVFQPEYYGETVAHPFSDLSNRQWLSFGGTSSAVNRAISAYKQVYTSNVEIYITDSDSAEFAKYMENAFLATKVIFCNEMYDLSRKLNVDYNKAREVWLADPRIGRSHTFVYEDNRGYGGSCLPKDVLSIIDQAHKSGSDCTLMEAVDEKNRLLKNNNQPEVGCGD